MHLPTFYVLDTDGTTVIPADALTWAQWFEDADRRIALTEIGTPPRWLISTVFIGINIAHTGEPLVFETMVFRLPEGGATDTHRYASRADAERGHLALVAAYEAR